MAEHAIYPDSLPSMLLERDQYTIDMFATEG